MLKGGYKLMLTLFYHGSKVFFWLSWWLSGIECRRGRFDPWVRKNLSGRKWQPTPVFLPGEFHRQRSLEGYSPWDRTEWLTFTFMLDNTYSSTSWVVILNIGGHLSGLEVFLPFSLLLPYPPQLLASQFLNSSAYFSAVLGLRGCARLCLFVGSGSYSPALAAGLLIALASPIAEHGL